MPGKEEAAPGTNGSGSKSILDVVDETLSSRDSEGQAVTLRLRLLAHGCEIARNSAPLRGGFRVQF